MKAMRRRLKRAALRGYRARPFTMTFTEHYSAPVSGFFKSWLQAIKDTPAGVPWPNEAHPVLEPGELSLSSLSIVDTPARYYVERCISRHYAMCDSCWTWYPIVKSKCRQCGMRLGPIACEYPGDLRTDRGYRKHDHTFPDYEDYVEARQAMRDVAKLYA